MSTDTDDDNSGLGHSTVVNSNINDAYSFDEEEEEVEEETVPTLLITANVGSIFEDPEQLRIAEWQQAVMKHIAAARPVFVAIHFQEVGGKIVQDAKVQVVRDFVSTLTDWAAESQGFDRSCVFFDQNYRSPETLTALGSLYLFHKSLSSRVDIYNFQTSSFVPLSSTSSLRHFTLPDDASVPFVQKRKFPLQLFPESRFSRKGFLRTRLRLAGTEIELLNIHLFHDACNLVSFDASPSKYREYRRRALQYTLDTVEKDDVHAPIFVFGDFNFRLEGRSVVKRLSCGLSRDASGSDLVFFRDNHEQQVVLSIGKKAFRMYDKDLEETFTKSWSTWTEYDVETSHVDDRLAEWPLNFPPTYPFEEDPSLGPPSQYMGTRCPAWCDRILFSHESRRLVSDEDGVTYDVVGRDVCMGDHKPVFLEFGLRAGMGNVCERGTGSNNNNNGHVVPSSPAPARKDAAISQDEGISFHCLDYLPQLSASTLRFASTAAGEPGK